MKKTECNVVQDLIPLVIDRVASDDSRELVENHISACPDCKEKYNAMKADLPDAIRSEYESEQQKFVDALRNVRKTRLKRRVLSLSIAILICAMAAFGGLFAYDRLVNQRTVPVDNALYSLSPSRLKNGSIVVTADSFGIDFDTSSNSCEVREDDKSTCYFYFTAAPIHANSHANDQSHHKKREMNIIGENGDQSIHEIRQGTPDNYVTVWTEGEPMAEASDQMELYFALDEQWMTWWDQLSATDDGKPIVDTEELYAWQDAMEQARLAVPEWQ